MPNNTEDTQIKKENNTIKEIAENIKFYLPLILIVPPILGGLWQVIELTFISPTYIRFFSTTQILPDGFLVLSFIIFLIPFFFLCPIFLPKLEDKERPAIDCIVQFLIIFIATLSVIIWIFTEHKSVLERFELYSFLLLIFFIFLMFSVISGFSFKQMKKYKNTVILEKFNSIKNYIHPRKKETFKELFSVGVMVVLLYSLMYLLFIFHSSSILPQELKNIEQLKNNLQSQENKILYLNDKYIFIEYIDKNATMIKIVKFDKLFEN